LTGITFLCMMAVEAYVVKVWVAEEKRTPPHVHVSSVAFSLWSLYIWCSPEIKPGAQASQDHVDQIFNAVSLFFWICGNIYYLRLWEFICCCCA
jgi:hypothetical protein